MSAPAVELADQQARARAAAAEGASLLELALENQAACMFLGCNMILPTDAHKGQRKMILVCSRCGAMQELIAPKGALQRERREELRAIREAEREAQVSLP